MKIIYTKHAIRKREILKELGWEISLDLIQSTLNEPNFNGKTKHGQLTSIKYLDAKHSLRVVYEVRNDIIVVITFHVSRRGRYEK